MLSVLGIVLVSMIQQTDTRTKKFVLVLGTVCVGGFYFVYLRYRRLRSDLDAVIGYIESNF